MKNVLIVCTGNTCRSPMAEAIMKEYIQKNNLNIEVKSAGISTVKHMPASAHAIEAMREKNIDLSKHQSMELSQDLIQWADIILAMTQAHVKSLNGHKPKALVMTLKEYAQGQPGDVFDPWGCNLYEYERCADELEMLIKQVIETIKQE